jgi:ferric-dicitrate binding protein FerR (iron transport regulator)
MSASPDSRLDELFVRYWDNALSQAEVDELSAMLANDPVAREWFQILIAQAVVAAELTSVPLPLASVQPASALQKKPRDSKRWSRRAALGLFSGTIAASVGAALWGYSWWESSCDPKHAKRVRISESKGAAMIRTPEGQTLPAEGFVPVGGTVATQGFGSTATLAFEDGSTVLLHSDSTISVQGDGQVLQLHKGTASADLRPRENEERITLATTLLTLAHVHNTAITVGLGAKTAEVEVYQGTVSVSAPTGEPMTVVREGELLTVGQNGVRSQQPAPATPEHFVWDLTVPLPEVWHVGHREVVDGTPVVRCEPYADPYYKGTVMQQIRSDNRWGRGFFSLAKGSTIYVRYRAKVESPRGQVCFCVRTKQTHCSDTGMLEYNGGFKACPDGKFKELRIDAESMAIDPGNNHQPKFGPPWVGFLVIFNTFGPDVGLEVAELRIDPPKK